jgi:hypothetical protein
MNLIAADLKWQSEELERMKQIEKPDTAKRREFAQSFASRLPRNI